MSDPVTRNRERVRQNRAARQRAIDQTPANLTTQATRIGAPYLPGERVFDVVSGLDGLVTKCSRAATLGALSVCVTLEDGSTVTRRRDDLIGPPTPSTGE